MCSQLYDVTEDQKNVFLVLEYCSGGDLQQLIKKHKTLDETAARHFFVQVYKKRKLIFFFHRY